MKLHNLKLKQTKDKEGNAIAGLWQCEIVRLEAVSGGWECSVPLRPIGRSNFFEFRPVVMGGRFKIVGTYKTKDGCCVVAERLKAGTHVYRSAYRDSDGMNPGHVVEWTSVSAEIALTAN